MHGFNLHVTAFNYVRQAEHSDEQVANPCATKNTSTTAKGQTMIHLGS